MQPHRFVCSQGAGGPLLHTAAQGAEHPQAVLGQSTRAWALSESSFTFLDRSTSFPFFFSSKVWGQEEEGGRMTVHFSGDAAMRILEGRADSVCQEGWSTGTGLSAPLQLCPGLRRLHPPRPRYAREVSGCPGRGRAAGAVGGPDPHPAVLVSTCSRRRETQQLETVNSLSIIILHITRV